jgi:peptide/nickel transport system permease protein
VGVRSAPARLLRIPSAVLGGVVLALYLATALCAPLLAPLDPTEGDIMVRLRPPAWDLRGGPAHPLGTDELGRDTLSRLVYGARVTLTVALGSTVLAAVLGSLVGLSAGFFRGRFDDLLSRLADWLLSFPTIVFAILLMGMLGPGVGNLLLVLSLKGWIPFFRLVRSEALVEREKAYVEAARALGKRSREIMLGDIAPNLLHSVLVLATIRVGIVALAESSLSYLGFGVSPSVPAWGSMIAGGREYLAVAWWLPVLPGAAILCLVLAVNLLGEGLRDALDPRLSLGAPRSARAAQPGGSPKTATAAPSPG